MEKELTVNKYSEREIQNRLSNVSKGLLTDFELSTIESYLAKPSLTPKNMFIIAKVLNMEISELLDKKTISPEKLSFRNKGSKVQKEKLFTILKFMVVAGKQIEMCEEC
ncbi:hypothetical protein QNJ25_00205 [Macrococcus caseolyticus]|uniref:hypothetical protein n=1 Tax=Macrococcoides caseolyticum TaxID=69966 RepID=UPI0024BC044F|nr:hypothetical protein [Macrococcus caseolyticus]MDJ1152363.1 hypothetical protein [Macrococcus caseolyticus]